MVLNVADAVYQKDGPQITLQEGCRKEKLRETVFIIIYPHRITITKYAQMVTICLLSRTGRAHGDAVGLSFIDFGFGAPQAQPSRYSAIAFRIREDQPRHVDIVCFPPSLGAVAGCRPRRRRRKRPVETFLPVHPKIQFDGSAMALRTKAVISSPSRSTLRSMSASIRFHRNCRKKPT